MSTIDELVAYCKIENPAGALLLTGEWGCGKTYLIENALKRELQNTHVVIRISLFGISSIEEVHKVVKNAWIHEKGGLVEKFSEVCKIREILNKVTRFFLNAGVKKVVGTVLALNIEDFIKIENKIETKSVVLVFDDFERSKLSVKERLGVVNEYCENQHFNVLIVADEGKITSKHYRDFKEKVVQRTVHLNPNYGRIVEGVVGSYKDSDYKTFLSGIKAEISALFAGEDLDRNSLDFRHGENGDVKKRLFDKENDEQEKRIIKLIKARPHNIRSLKCAIQDFERIYSILNEKSAGDTKKWLFSFLSFNMASKANLANKSEKYGAIFAKQDIGVIYPGFFDSRFFPDALEEFVLKGTLDKEKIIFYIDMQNKAAAQASPKEQVKNSRLDYLDEEIAVEGFKEIIDDAYNGTLTLSEYVNFICNAKIARVYRLVDTCINWKAVCVGIRQKIEDNIAKGETRERHILKLQDLEQYSEDERKAYAIIQNARDASFMVIEHNRREYIKLMHESPNDVFTRVSDKRYRCFDNEMVYATVEAFKTVDNYDKMRFLNYFKGMWLSYRTSFDIINGGIEKSQEGFLTLKEALKKLCDEYSNQPFKKSYTETFISVVDELIEAYKDC